MFVFPSNVVEKFTEWNEKMETQTPEYDKRFVQTLLLLMVSESSLASSMVNENIRAFISRKIFSYLTDQYVEYIKIILSSKL